jgi:hypothetical protein
MYATVQHQHLQPSATTACSVGHLPHTFQTHFYCNSASVTRERNSHVVGVGTCGRAKTTQQRTPPPPSTDQMLCVHETTAVSVVQGAQLPTRKQRQARTLALMS